jgi:hypothetical protein
MTSDWTKGEHWLAAIDSGAKECAVAVYLNRVLTCVLYAPTSEPLTLGMTRAVYEIPQGDGRSVPVDDLIGVACGGAKVAAWLANDVRGYTVREWKGSKPKAPHHAELWDVLTPEEQAVLGGDDTLAAILKACERGARARWKRSATHHYSARDLPTVGRLKITHDLLDAAALGAYDLGRLGK